MGVADDHNTAVPYSHAEWAHSNLGHYQVGQGGGGRGDFSQEAEAARQRSESLRNDVIRLVEDRHVRTNRSHRPLIRGTRRHWTDGPLMHSFYSTQKILASAK